MWSKQIEHHDGKAFLVKFKSLNWLKLQSNWLKLLNTNRGNVFSPFCSFRYWQFRTWIVGGNEIWVLSHFLSSSFHQEIWPNLKGKCAGEHQCSITHWPKEPEVTGTKKFDPVLDWLSNTNRNWLIWAPADSGWNLLQAWGFFAAGHPRTGKSTT